MSQERNYFKILFILISVFTVSLILWNTFVFFNQLKENERKKMEIWASAQELLIQEDLDSDLTQLALDILTKNNTTPMILYHFDSNSENPMNNYTFNNIPPEKVKNVNQVEKMIESFKKQYTPIEVTYEDEVYSIIYYGNSELIRKITYYPIIIVLIIFLFVSVVYFFFRTRKVSEQNRLWAGMAKETAHQIGTPLSSLVGWTEILKQENVNPEFLLEMEKDIFRLQTITDRFSKIGSMPVLEKKDIVSETLNSIDYLKLRSSKLIEFETNLPEKQIFVMMNRQLYGWAIENLVKNAIDAMKGQGKVTIEIIENGGNQIHLLVTDTGKGMPKNHFSKVFTPGFTTKTRGWGLGLSLTKRIIEDYHNGKIRVKDSIIDKGSCFQITLKKTE
ncbi:MAG TPA: HAMP domain-containing sensor histidine kinase [Flavobacteriaceae bacterium]|nr:HAMP domain-containing sensor histidine kinase [Flavobacteriaceae bacterium]